MYSVYLAKFIYEMLKGNIAVSNDPDVNRMTEHIKKFDYIKDFDVCFTYKNNTYLDSSSVVHNKVALNTILTPNYMIIGKSVEPLRWEDKGTWATMDFKTRLDSNGTKLTHSGNAIKIGTGVSKIRVVAQVLYDGSNVDASSNYIFMRISQNNVGKSKTINGFHRWGTLHTEAILKVSSGDLIKCDVLKSMDVI